ncbi:MAG: hypothetical protein EA359_11080 [Balneolaceae bacterium]|nr:MAG: hypothetical protein EA359_11080 [Balneolaceae bacterium]
MVKSNTRDSSSTTPNLSSGTAGRGRSFWLRGVDQDFPLHHRNTSHTFGRFTADDGFGTFYPRVPCDKSLCDYRHSPGVTKSITPPGWFFGINMEMAGKTWYFCSYHNSDTHRTLLRRRTTSNRE